MTNLSGRMPPSFSLTYYNEGAWNDNTPWSGIIINEPNWNGRDQVGIYFLLDVGDGTYLKADSNNFLYLADPIFGSSWSGRIIP